MCLCPHVVEGVRGSARLLEQRRKKKRESLDVTATQLIQSIGTRSPVYVTIGTDQTMVEDWPFYVAKVNSVRKSKKKRRVGTGQRSFWYISKDEWYVNIVWLESKSMNDKWKLKLGDRDVCLLESLLTNPETHVPIEPVFEEGTLNVVPQCVIDMQQTIDTHSFRDSARKNI